MSAITMHEKQALVAYGHENGISLMGFCAPVLESCDKERFIRWLAQGMHADMDYLARTKRMRIAEEEFLPGQRSVIICGFPYPVVESPHIVPYALCKDYHNVVRQRLEGLEMFLKQIFPGVETKIFVDTAPVLERFYAIKAGIGVPGKNTLLLNRAWGSRFVLGGIMTTLAVDPDMPKPENLCGSCRLCVDACPTNALAGGCLDARKCISYHTIENKGAIPEEIVAKMGQMVYGCGICEKVCALNQRQREVLDWEVYTVLANADLERLLVLATETFKKHFCKTPIYRLGKKIFLRNIMF